MKVLFLNVFDDPVVSGGGAEVTLQHLTQGLLSRGVEPVMLATDEKPGLHQSERGGMRVWHAGLRNMYWPRAKVARHPLRRMAWHALDSYNVAMQPLLREVLQTERPDVVSLHNLPGWSAASWDTIASLGIPSVQVLHDMYLICAKTTMYTEKGNCSGQCPGCRAFRLPHRRASAHVSAVVGVSRFILQRHLDQGYFRNVPIQRVINNARDAETLGCDNHILRDRGPLRFGYIGRLDASKGIERLLEAFSTIDVAGAELWIAGSGNGEYVQTLRDRWGSERIKFLGRMMQRDFYTRVDVVVVPSLWNDTFPGVVFEAFAFGKPVIGSRRGGIPEMVMDGKNGLLFDPDVSGSLASVMQSMAQSPSMRAGLGKHARDSAQQFLDKNAWLDRYMNLYAEVSGRRKYE